MITVAYLRTIVPAFADTGKYPDALFTPWLTLADKVLLPARWGDWLDVGQAWFAAHFVAINLPNGNRLPGTGQGIIASKSLGGASLSYDTASSIETDAGHWNLTAYGTQFIRTAKMVGTGGIQLGGADVPAGSSFSPGWSWVI